MPDESEPPRPPASPPPPPAPYQPPPPPAYAQATPQWQDLDWLKTLLTVMLALCIAVTIFAVVAVVNRLGVLDDIESGSFGFDVVQRAQDADDLADAAAIILLAVTLLTGIFFILWFFRAAKNNEALGRMQPRLGPGWAIGAWFIPLANLVMPALIAQDLWRGSDSSVPRGEPRWRIAPRSALVGWWWAAWVIGGGLRFGAGGGGSDADRLTLDEVQTSNRLALVGLVIFAVGGVLAILVVRKLTERQQACLRAQQGAWNQASGQTPPPPS